MKCLCLAKKKTQGSSGVGLVCFCCSSAECECAAFQAELSRLSEIENSLAIFCMATYGEGDPTDNAQDFYDWLQENDDENLSGLNYTVSLSPALAFRCVFLCILVSSACSSLWYLLLVFLEPAGIVLICAALHHIHRHFKVLCTIRKKP